MQDDTFIEAVTKQVISPFHSATLVPIRKARSIVTAPLRVNGEI